MANGVSDFSLDPMQVEEDLLDQQYKNILARKLKQGASSVSDIPGMALDVMDRITTPMQLAQVEKKQKELGEKYKETLIEALRGQDPEIVSLVSSPATRAQGLALMQKKQTQKMDQEEMDRLNSQEGSGSGGIPSFQTVANYMKHSNPTIAARGKAMYDLYYAPQDPVKSQTRNATGGYVPIPGALSGQQIRQVADNTPRMVPDGQGGMRDTTQGEEYARTTGAGGGPPPQALPQSAGPPPNLPMPATSAPPPGMGGGSPPPGNTPSGPISPASGPVSSPPGSGPPGGGLPPEAQQLIAILQNPQVPIPVKDQAAAALTKMGIDFSGMTSDPSVQPKASVLSQTIGAAPPSGPPPQALPQSAGPNLRDMPRGPPGTVPPKVSTDLYQKTREKDLEQLVKAEESLHDLGTVRDQITRFEVLNKQPSHSGIGFDIAKGANYLGITSGPKYQNSRAQEALIKEMSGPRAKQFGYNPSNIDLITALAQLPSMSDDPATRQAVIDQLKSGLAYHEMSLPAIRQMVESGMSMAEAQQKFDRWYRSDIGPGAPKENPSKAGGEQTSALPATVAAHGGTPPTFPPTNPNDPTANIINGKPTYPYQPPSFTGFFTDNPELGPGLARSVAGLHKSMLGPEADQAALDVVKGQFEAGKNLFGYGDREATNAEAKRQSEISNPQYRQAREFFDVFNPPNLVPGNTLLRSTLAAAVPGLLTPGGDSPLDQVVGGVKDAALNFLPAAVTNKFLPSTKLPARISQDGVGEETLKAFPSFKPTSAQMAPRNADSAVTRGLGINEAAALDQSAAITKDLMTAAGIEGKTITGPAVKARLGQIDAELGGLMPKNIKANVSSADRTALIQLTERIDLSSAPTLKLISGALKGGDQYRALKVPATQLFTAWKEAKDLGKHEIASTIEGMIKRTVPPESATAFAKLNDQSNLVRDLDNIVAKEGLGTGSAAGYINPSRILKYVSDGVVRHPMIDKAVDLINRFDVTDYKAASPGSNFWDPVASGAKVLAGPVLKATEYVDTQAGAGKKKLIELLRAYGMHQAGPSGDNNAAQ